MPHQHSTSSASISSSSSLRDFTTSRFGSLSGLSLWAASGSGNEVQASQEQQESQTDRSLASPLDLKSPQLDGDEADQLDWADEKVTGREGVPNK